MTLGAAGVVATAAPAQAAWASCPADYSCFYPQSGGGGTPWKPSTCGWHNLPFQVISVWNRGHGTIYWYNGSTYTGWSTPVGNQGSNGALSANRVNIAC
ncbi:peptidase inhibitor family I36 protein [Micromonospora sp. NPDC002296]|uniref:peptidase inhibitor family I36 protein n=1 Tax=Micromonospora sp. NPDC002296 TaxID=3154271 RepID=UPI003322A2C9